LTSRVHRWASATFDRDGRNSCTLRGDDRTQRSTWCVGHSDHGRTTHGRTDHGRTDHSGQEGNVQFGSVLHGRVQGLQSDRSEDVIQVQNRHLMVRLEMIVLVVVD